MCVGDVQVIAIPEILGAFQVVLLPVGDSRGWFRDSVRLAELPDNLGDIYQPRQVSVSHSVRSVARGMHYSVTEPEAAYFQTVTCAAGRVTDILVDLRVGSPTFGGEFITDLAPELGITLLMPPGVGHGFKVVGASATLVYTMSRNYPSARTGAIRLEGVSGRFVLSESSILSNRDRDSPSLRVARESGLLPQWEVSAPSTTSDAISVAPRGVMDGQ